MKHERPWLMIDADWLSSYAVGTSEIDADHDHLFAGLKTIREAFTQARYDDCRRQLIRLITEVDEHFDREEAWLNETSRAGARQHASRHGILRRRLKTVGRQVEDLDLPPRALADLIDAVSAVVLTDHLTLDREWDRDAAPAEKVA